MKILVTGATGYKGSVLIPKLLNNGYQVNALDTMWFGNFLPSNENLTILNKDVRNIKTEDLDNVSKVIHLASVANDPCGDLNPELTWGSKRISYHEIGRGMFEDGSSTVYLRILGKCLWS